MPTITDPSFLSQGNTTSSYTNTTTLRIQKTAADSTTGTLTFVGGTAINVSQYDYFELRTSNTTLANNNGLYQVNSGTGPWNVTKIAGTDGALANTNVGGDITFTVFGSDAVAGNTTPGTGLVEAATGKSVYFDPYQKKIWLINQGNVTDEGVTLQALYSFAKEEWKNDPDLIKYDFPFTAITPEQFEIGSGTSTGWQLFANTITTTATFDGIDGNGRKTRELIRTGGWSEFDLDGTTLLRQYAGVISLGTFDNDNDLAYYQQGNDPTDSTASENFVFTGPVNEGVLTYDLVHPDTTATGQISYPHSNTISRATGDWTAEGFQVGGQITIVTSDESTHVGTFEIESLTATDLEVTTDPFNTAEADDQNYTAAWDNRNRLKLFLRANSTVSVSKSYDSGTLTDIGVTTLSNQVYRFPLTNASDVVVDNVDTAEGAGSAWFDTVPFKAETKDNIIVQYFYTAFKARVNEQQDPPALQEFGIVINNGSYSGVDGSITPSTTFTSNKSIFDDRFNAGKLYITTGTANTYDQQTSGYTIVDIPTPQTLTVSPAFTTTESALSFYITPSTANNTAFEVPATIQEIYASIQYQLREDSDIDATGNTVIGRTADELLTFVGTDAVVTGSTSSPPSNPNGGGSGVFIANYAEADTNKITVVTNAGVEDNFPTVVTLTLNFNDNLTDDQIDGGSVDYSQFWLFFQYGRRRTGAFVIGSPTNNTATITLAGAFALDSGTTQLQVNDYLKFSGFTNDVNNGLWKLLSRDSNDQITAVKVDGLVPTGETAPTTANIDEGAIDTPNAIIVDNNVNADIAGDVDAATKSFSYAFTTNQQGPKPTSQVTPVIVRAIGLEAGQFVETAPSDLGSENLTISITSGLERNYSNP